MKQGTKDTIIAVLWIIMKVLSATRTGIDTFAVSHDLLDVLLIDGAFLANWLVASYAGQGQLAMAIRPFAAGTAWLLYLLMLSIAWQAGMINQSVSVSLIARVAGGAMLLADTWTYVVQLAQRRHLRTQQTDWRTRLRSMVWAVAYAAGALASVAFVVCVAVVRAMMDYVEDARTQPYARPVVIAPERTHVRRLAQGSVARYVLTATRAHCLECERDFGSRTYVSLSDAQPAFAAHARSHKHIEVASTGGIS